MQLLKFGQMQDQIQGELMQSLDKTNLIFMMSDSGARVVTHLTLHS